MNGWTDRQIDTLPVAELATKTERWLSTNVFLIFSLKNAFTNVLNILNAFISMEITVLETLFLG